MTATATAVAAHQHDEPDAKAFVRETELVDYRLVKSYIWMSFLWLLIAPLMGFLFAMKFTWPQFLNWGTWTSGALFRQVHVNGVIFGWYTIAAFGLTHYYVPKLCGRPMWSKALSWGGFWIYSIFFLGGEISILAQYTQGIELGEFPMFIDAGIATAFVLITINILMTIYTRREKQLYVALWYTIAAFVWTSLNWCVGNFLLPYTAAGPNSAALHGFYLHNLVGLWITPSGLAIIYYFLPPAAKNPLFSHKLSILGFWTLGFFYPFNGTHHYIFSPIDEWVQTVAIVASMFLFVPVWAVNANFFGTMRGHWTLLPRSGVLKFLMMGAVFYLIGCAQGPIEALRTVQAWTHFSDFVIGHSHVTIFGCFTFWAWAGIYFVWPRLTGRKIYSSALVGWHFWLATLGFTLMFIVLTISGLMQNASLHANVEFIDSIIPIKIWWLLRSVGGSLMIASMWVFMYNIWMTGRKGEPLGDELSYRDYSPAATDRYSRPGPRLEAAPERFQRIYDDPAAVGVGQGVARGADRPPPKRESDGSNLATDDKTDGDGDIDGDGDGDGDGPTPLKD